VASSIKGVRIELSELASDVKVIEVSTTTVYVMLDYKVKFLVDGK
jgi:hypothetical protein